MTGMTNDGGGNVLGQCRNIQKTKESDIPRHSQNNGHGRNNCKQHAQSRHGTPRKRRHKDCRRTECRSSGTG